MSITLKAQTVLSELSTPQERAKASEKAITHGLASGTCSDSESLAENISGHVTVQDLYAQQLIGFYDHASTHYHVNTNNSMIDDFKNGKKIHWENYSIFRK